MARSLIKLVLSSLGFDALLSFAQTIHDGFVAEIADYPTPNPLMAAFQSDIDALSAAIIAWGPAGARGSHAQHVALINAANVVQNDLRMLADYAQNTMPDNPTSWGLVGFPVKRAKSAPVALEMVQNFRRFIARDIPDGFIKLRWERPLDTDPNDVKGYIIQYSNSNVQPELDGSRGVVNVLKIVPNTFAQVAPPFSGANFFWVTPYNSVGYGVSSDPLFYNAPGKILPV
jgi:hypothetical protein